MIDDILNDVESPFSNELIQELIETFISCGCDYDKFYSEVNHTEANDRLNDSYELINYIEKIGIPKEKAEKYEDENKPIPPLLYDAHGFHWMTLYSKEEPLNDKVDQNGKWPLIYRFYLNLKGQDKADFVKGYLKECQQKGIPFHFKFSKTNSREDQIVLLSRLEDFEDNFSIISDLTKDKGIGTPPKLVGKHKNNVGIDEEYYIRCISPTQAKLLVIISAITKYVCDYNSEFYEQLSNDEKEMVDTLIQHFKKEIEFVEEFGEAKIEYYQKKGELDCLKENIEFYQGNRCDTRALLKFSEIVQKIYASNPEQFIQESIKNYRMIGTQVWGFSKDFVFSNETEERRLPLEKTFLTPEKVLTCALRGTTANDLAETGYAEKTRIESKGVQHREDE